MSCKRYNRIHYQNCQRAKASSFISATEKQQREAFHNLCLAIIKTVIVDGDLSFFNSQNHISDVILELAGIDRQLAYEKTKLNYNDKAEKAKIHRGKSWSDNDLKPYFNGKLTIKEISEITGINKNTLYYRAHINDWEYQLAGTWNLAHLKKLNG